jgi:hypothetical protein
MSKMVVLITDLTVNRENSSFSVIREKQDSAIDKKTHTLYQKSMVWYDNMATAGQEFVGYRDRYLKEFGSKIKTLEKPQKIVLYKNKFGIKK